MTHKFTQLAALGAGNFDHLNGPLIRHLEGTRSLLKQWGATTVLQGAGLYHAVYGTEGFDQPLVSTDRRAAIAAIIGSAAENLVYQYCACDRDYVWPQFGGQGPVGFRNRFTGECLTPPTALLSDFCELTAANELDIARHQPDGDHRWLSRLLTAMAPYLSPAATTWISVWHKQQSD